MSDEISVAKVLDLKGLACPMPVVKVSKGIKEVEVNEVGQHPDTVKLAKWGEWFKRAKGDK